MFGDKIRQVASNVIDSYTVSLLHFDNSAIQDETGKVWTASNCSLTSTYSKFGGKSLYIPGGSEGYINTSNLSGLDFGTGDFTIDFWCLPGYSYSSGSVPIYNTSSNSVDVVINNGMFMMNINFNSGSNILCWGGPSVVAYTWYHVAGVRNGNVFSLFVNGVLAQSKTQSGINISSPTTYVRFGGPAGGSFTGCLDEFRVSSIARWTAKFTPPTSPY